MKLSAFVEIEKPITDVWKTTIDFKNCFSYIESIVKIEIIDEPKDTLIGFKWKETRVMLGKEATETMWITDYVENEYYQTRAESHGSVYTSRLSLENVGGNTKLMMSFSAEAQTIVVKVFSFCMGLLLKGSMKKVLTRDLNNIKTHLESN